MNRSEDVPRWSQKPDPPFRRKPHVQYERRKARLLKSRRGRFYVVAREDRSIHGQRPYRYKTAARLVVWARNSFTSTRWRVGRIGASREPSEEPGEADDQ